MLTRRGFLGATAASGALLAGSPATGRAAESEGPDVKSGWIDHIPACWVEPGQLRAGTNAVVWLSWLGGRKEDQVPQLRDLAAAGFLAVSFDPWLHGERGSENDDAILARVFGNFRRHMWPILGQTALDSLRVIDWLQARGSSADVRVTLHAGYGHRDLQKPEFWAACLDWFRQH